MKRELPFTFKSITIPITEGKGNIIFSGVVFTKPFLGKTCSVDEEFDLLHFSIPKMKITFKRGGLTIVSGCENVQFDELVPLIERYVASVTEPLPTWGC